MPKFSNKILAAEVTFGESVFGESKADILVSYIDRNGYKKKVEISADLSASLDIAPDWDKYFYVNNSLSWTQSVIVREPGNHAQLWIRGHQWQQRTGENAGKWHFSKLDGFLGVSNLESIEGGKGPP